MRKLITLALLAIATSAARAYVYEYTDHEQVSASAQTGDVEDIFGVGVPNPPGNVTGPIGTLLSSVFVNGRTPGGSAGAISAGGLNPPPGPGIVVETTGINTDAAPLSTGAVIGPSSNWAGGGFIGGYTGVGYPVGDPAFLAPGGAYVGFEIPDANNQIHYGWLLVEYDQPPDTYFGTLELEEVAYETDPGVPITIAPEPAAVALGIAAIFATEVRRASDVAKREWDSTPTFRC